MGQVHAYVLNVGGRSAIERLIFLPMGVVVNRHVAHKFKT